MIIVQALNLIRARQFIKIKLIVKTDESNENRSAISDWSISIVVKFQIDRNTESSSDETHFTDKINRFSIQQIANQFRSD